MGGGGGGGEEDFGRQATFWFGTFVMLLAPLGVLFVMTTLKDEC